ncbi:hypothetical protein PICSAR11_04026 [Mycobacterium avium subsp. paratuberculosis]|nr:hypothetical protein PICSAR103_00192 [Mycobacterium avium subsp. paratuberculosis]CAG6852876.1 hypothetical protein PICSAR100_00194 [Mycobacterium avium subsp. paratuberculosis]CAG6875882.1 hypothetical protein PICSAR118_01428 [Mycobacterium avium subsp. paratuberculosis]CAG6926954.1 hypothetical protein PICSAR10_03913 [Mycobacterium avium subsp. paratuberculosis]CAG6928008.1 hypothetical protein PICSAR11_04026 [Mycobacterium avium subsp. paratuberculosis]
MNHNRFCAKDSGTTSGRPAATSGASPPALCAMRGASWAMVGASKTVRTGRSVSSAELIAVISRIVVSESPPRSKNESSTPTRCTPSTSA